MKRLLAFILVIVALSTCLLSCKKNYDKEVEAAFEDVRAEWEKLYATSKVERKDSIHIVNTQVSKIKDDCDIEYFKDVDLVIEFTILSDYLGHGAEDYFSYAGICDTVVIYKDGTRVVTESFFKSYGAQVYDFDYSEILEVVYFGDKYNTYLTIAGKNK